MFVCQYLNFYLWLSAWSRLICSYWRWSSLKLVTNNKYNFLGKCSVFPQTAALCSFNQTNNRKLCICWELFQHLHWHEFQLALHRNVLQREAFYFDTLSTFHNLYFIALTWVKRLNQFFFCQSCININICTSTNVKNVCTLATSEYTKRKWKHKFELLRSSELVH